MLTFNVNIKQMSVVFTVLFDTKKANQASPQLWFSSYCMYNFAIVILGSLYISCLKYICFILIVQCKPFI